MTWGEQQRDPVGAVQTWVVDTEPLEYHRLLRGIPRYRWWKPLVMLLLAAAIYGVFNLLIGAAWFAIILAQNLEAFASSDTDAFLETLFSELMLDTQNPLSVFMNLSAVILMIPAVLLAMLATGMRPVGRIWSVAARIRWGLLGRTLGFAVLAIIVTNAVGIGLSIALHPGALAEEAPPLPEVDLGAALLSLLFVLLLVPFQAAAEEVVFRGVFMQVLGSWLRSPWFGILIPSVLFALAHIYDVWGMTVVGLLGVAAAWLTWRTGGLEAAIGIHVVNNLFAFGVLASGVSGETSQAAEGAGIESVIGQAAGLGVYVWLVTASFRKHRYGRTRIDRIEVSGPPLQQRPGVQHG